MIGKIKLDNIQEQQKIFDLKAFKKKHGLYKVEEEDRLKNQGKSSYQQWLELIDRGGL